MLTNHKAIVTGLFVEIYAYKHAYNYGTDSTLSHGIKGQAKGDLNLIKSQSAYRAKNMVRRLIQGNIHNHQKYRPVFLTLTFRENITDISQANRHFTYFITKLKRYIQQDIQYIGVPEYQKRGAVHYHVLMLNLPFIEQRRIEQLWSHGIINIKAVNRTTGLYLYMTKYITKSFDNPLSMSKKRYFHSLPNKPEVIHDNLTAIALYEAQDKDTLINQPKVYKVMWKGKEVNEVKKFEYLAQIEAPIV